MTLLDVIDAELERIHEALAPAEYVSAETRVRLLAQLETLIQFLTQHHKPIYVDTKGNLHT